MSEPEKLEPLLIETMRAARLLYMQGAEEDAREIAFNRCIPLVIAFVTNSDPEDFLVFEVCDSPIFPTPEVEA